MEYRKRQRRGHNRRIRHASYTGTVLCVMLLFAAIVYLIGVSSAGTWMAQTIIAPVFRTLGVTEEKDNSSEVLSAPVTDTLKFEGKKTYALQMGVYSNRDNASKQSDALQKLGAGGYIYDDGGKQRVLASAYPSESDLLTVRKRLTEEGVESSVFVFERPAVEWVVTADKEQIRLIEQALKGLLDSADALYETVYSFDSEKQSVSVGKTALTMIQTTLKNHADALTAYSSDTVLLNRLSSTYEAVINALSDVINYDEKQTVLFSAKMKYLYMHVEDQICRFLYEIEKS